MLTYDVARSCKRCCSGFIGGRILIDAKPGKHARLELWCGNCNYSWNADALVKEENRKAYEGVGKFSHRSGYVQRAGPSRRSSRCTK